MATRPECVDADCEKQADQEFSHDRHDREESSCPHTLPKSRIEGHPDEVVDSRELRPKARGQTFVNETQHNRAEYRICNNDGQQSARRSPPPYGSVAHSFHEPLPPSSSRVSRAA